MENRYVAVYDLVGNKRVPVRVETWPSNITEEIMKTYRERFGKLAEEISHEEYTWMRSRLDGGSEASGDFDLAKILANLRKEISPPGESNPLEELAHCFTGVCSAILEGVVTSLRDSYSPDAVQFLMGLMGVRKKRCG